MIELRLKTIESPDDNSKYEIVDKENLYQALCRVLCHVPLGDKNFEELFTVLVNGHIIEKDMWDFVILRSSDSVLIAPKLKGGDNGSLLRVTLITIISAVASVYLTPAGGATVYSALAVAGVTIAGSLLVYALIPPPVANGIGGISGDSSLSQSQMYSINGQSNQIKRYSTVPKVYGTHRVFPTVAANPYVEIEAADNGELVQYLYVVYDFGLGPVYVQDLKIGDSDLPQFSDVKYNFVDPNKPNTPEGIWDTSVEKTFKIYKKEVFTDNVGVALNDNQNEGGGLAGYQLTRNATPNPDLLQQEITINFVNPSGLYSYSSTGQIGSNLIDIAIYFAKVGTEDWHPANDFNYVFDFSESGGFEQFAEVALDLVPPGLIVSNYTLQSNSPALTTYTATDAEISGATLSEVMGARFWGAKKVYGYSPSQQKYIIAASNPEVVLGRSVHARFLSSGGPSKIQSTFLGYVTQIVPTGNPSYVNYVLDNSALFDKSYPIFEEITGTLDSSPPRSIYRLSPTVGGATVNRQISGRGKIQRSTTDQSFATYKFTPREIGEYKVRITRLVTTPQYTSQKQSDLTVQSISTRFDRDAISTSKRHTFLEMRIRATNQLNGVISNLSGLATSAIPVWNGSAWVRQLSNNPAWVFADLLTGQVNKRPIAQSKLHTTSLLEWANFCSAVPTSPSNHNFTKPRFESNFILDYDATLQTVLGQVSSAAQAGLNSIDGKYGVLIDKLRTVPVQIFTPRNSSNFSSTRIYTKKPDAIKVKYIDSGDAYQVAELIVYDDGFTFANAVEFDEITSFACTNSEQAWRFGRYLLAQNRLRQETISLTVDFEYLVCTRGDFVQIVQDVMKVGGSPARVRSISGNTIIIDDGLSLPPGSYGYVFRGNNGLIQQGTITTVVNSSSYILSGPLPVAGNLIVIGLVGQVVFNCMVKSITPGENLTANLVLIEKADAVYTAESLNTFPVYDPQLNKFFDPDTTAPGPISNLEVTDNTWRCNGSQYQYYIGLDWDAPTDSTYETFYVYADTGSGFNKVGDTRESMFEYIVDETKLGLLHTFKVLAVGSNGKKIELVATIEITATPLSKTTAPSDVGQLSIDITGEVLQLVWPQITDCDVEEYLIRYSPAILSATWATSVPLLRLGKNSTLASTQARTGTYLIKAVDFNGNESANAILAVTTVPDLFNLNVITETTDFPALAGSFDRTEKLGSALLLRAEVPGGPDTREYYAEGFYYYQDLLDLGGIYTVRLQSRIQAEGYTENDLMRNWLTLSSVLLMSNAKTSEWDVETQYRSTDILNVMSSWTTLTSVSPISGGASENFTPWRKFIMGDATGRIFQFRLKLVSNKTSVTPRVIDGTIRADMPDRVESYHNVVAPNTGYTLVYDPAFKGPGTTPAISISMQNAQSGDYWTFDHRNLSEFKIYFYNSSNVAVNRTFDAVVKGHGRLATGVI